MTKWVFIDSNIYLSLYRISSDDVKELQKLSHAVSAKEIRLILPDQVKDEFWRNRFQVIDSAIRDSESNCKIPTSFPKSFTGRAKHEAVLKSCRELIRQIDDLTKEVRKAAVDNELAADLLISELFDSADLVPCTDTIFDRARARFDRGNPPGKDNSYGDAINWEALMERVDPGDDLFVLTDDKDYADVSGKTRTLKQFLKMEWDERKGGGKIELFSDLNTYLTKYYPDIELKIGFELEGQVAALADSENFAATHQAIAQMDPRAPYSQGQLTKLIDAALENDQVYRIGSDYDVQAFYRDLIAFQTPQLAANQLSFLKEQFEIHI